MADGHRGPARRRPAAWLDRSAGFQGRRCRAPGRGNQDGDPRLRSTAAERRILRARGMDGGAPPWLEPAAILSAGRRIGQRCAGTPARRQPGSRRPCIPCRNRQCRCLALRSRSGTADGLGAGNGRRRPTWRRLAATDAARISSPSCCLRRLRRCGRTPAAPANHPMTAGFARRADHAMPAGATRRPDHAMTAGARRRPDHATAPGAARRSDSHGCQRDSVHARLGARSRSPGFHRNSGIRAMTHCWVTVDESATIGEGRRSLPAYRDDADAAARLSVPRPRAGRPRSRLRGSRSRPP